jgi:hypothetical protein
MAHYFITEDALKSESPTMKSREVLFKSKLHLPAKGTDASVGIRAAILS